MSDVLYYPAFYPSNPLVDSRIRGLPDFMFGAPPPVAWGNPFMRQPARAPSVLSLPTTATPEPYTPEEMTPVTPDPTTPPPLTTTLLDDDIMRIRFCLVKKKNLYSTLLDILPNRSYEHRSKFIERYREIYRANLLEDLFKQTKPHNYYFAIRAMLELYRVTRLHSLFIAMEGKATGRFLSLEGLGTDEEALAEILFMATNGQIHYCQSLWSSYYRGYDLNAQLEDETSGNFARLLVALAKGERDETGSIDMNQVNVDVVELYDTGENRTSNLLHIFSRRSHTHIRLIMEQFQKKYKTDLGAFMTRYLSGQLKGDDFFHALKSFLQAVKDDIKFYALRLHECVQFLTHGSIKDLPIDIVSSRQTIVRIIITQHEFDLTEIKEKYNEISGIQLEVSVSEVFKESKFIPLRQLLLALLKEQEITLIPEVQQIHAAVTKKGKTSNVIFSLLSSSNYERRKQIVRQFNIYYKLNLLAKVEEYMKPGEQLFTMRALIESHESTDLRSLWIAMEGKKTGKLFAKETVELDEATLLEILFLATNREISYFHENYHRVTGHNLIDHITKATSNSGKFSNLLLRLIEGKRWEESHSDQDLVKHDSSLLYQLTNSDVAEEEIIDLFSQRSLEHLKILFRDYEEIYEKSVVDLLTDTFKGKKQHSLLTALLSCVTAVQNRARFYAIRLLSCLDFVRERNGNTPDSVSHKQSIVRIMLTHAETDLDRIKAIFSGLSKDNQPLDLAVQSAIKEVELLVVMNNILEEDPILD